MPRIEQHDNDANSLSAKVFGLLQNDIINGVYEPGDSLVETKLSLEFGVSRTPIREAIKQLELEGLVQSIPNKGTVVTGISRKDIEDIYTIRVMIEGLAAKWAAENISGEELAELKEAIDLEEFYTLKNDLEHSLKFDSKFHETLFKASKSRPLMHVLKTFHHYIQRARSESFETPGRATEALNEHKAILEAIIEKNPEKAQKLTNEHVKNASICFTKQKNELKNK